MIHTSIFHEKTYTERTISSCCEDLLKKNKHLTCYKVLFISEIIINIYRYKLIKYIKYDNH